jgi:hypothetical protein
LANLINTVCASAIQLLTYEQLIILFDKLALLDDIKEKQEIAVLRLMSLISPTRYLDFYSHLEANDNQVSKNLIENMHDASIYFWDENNYTGYIGGLVYMFNQNIEAIVQQTEEADNPNLLSEIINLNPRPFGELSYDFGFGYSIVNTGMFRFTGVQNSNTGKVTIQRQANVVIATGESISNTWHPDENPFDDVSPMTPIIITSDSDLPLIATALDTDIIDSEQMYLVPAIFLHYARDKELQNYIEEAVITSLDIATILGSGGAALATKIHWAKRIWALMEVSGAVANIGVNTVEVSPQLRSTVDNFNLAMGVIGISHVGRGLYHFGANLADNTKLALANNESIRAIVTAKFLDWKVSITNLDNLNEAEKILIQEGRIAELRMVDGINSKLTDADFTSLEKQWDGWRLMGVNGAGSTGIQIIDDFLALAPKIDVISPSSVPNGYQIITKNGSKYIRRIDVSNPNTPRLMVDHTGTIVPYAKPQRLSSNNLLRSRLEQANGGVIPDGHQAHHLVPDNVVQNSPLHQEVISRGLYDIDRVSNGKLLAETAEDYVPLSEAYPTHFGSHPNYDAQIIEAMNDILDLHNVLPSQISSLSDTKLLEIIDDIEGAALDILTDWIPSKLN